MKNKSWKAVNVDGSTFLWIINKLNITCCCRKYTNDFSLTFNILQNKSSYWASNISYNKLSGIKSELCKSICSIVFDIFNVSI